MLTYDVSSTSQTLVTNLVQFTTIFLILGTMNNIFSIFSNVYKDNYQITDNLNHLKVTICSFLCYGITVHVSYFLKYCAMWLFWICDFVKMVTVRKKFWSTCGQRWWSPADFVFFCRLRSALFIFLFMNFSRPANFLFFSLIIPVFQVFKLHLLVSMYITVNT